MIIKGMLRKIVDPPLSIQELHKALHNFILARSKGLRSEEHTSELQSRSDLVCRLLLEKKKIHRHAFSRTRSNSTMRSRTTDSGNDSVLPAKELIMAGRSKFKHANGGANVTRCRQRWAS